MTLPSSPADPAEPANLYAAPDARIEDPQLAQAAGQRYYVVAPRKFLLLYVMTFSAYSLYWAYRQWSRERRATGDKLWPVARSIFQLFFTHALFQRINTTLARTGIAPRWGPATAASVYVVFLLAGGVADRIARWQPDSPWPLALSFASLLPCAWALLQGQNAANVASDDPTGASNARLSLANWAWLALGAVGWLMVLGGLWILANPEQFPR